MYWARVRGFVKPKWLCESVIPAGILNYICAILGLWIDLNFSIFVLFEIFFKITSNTDSQWNGKERKVLKACACKSVCERKFRDYKKFTIYDDLTLWLSAVMQYLYFAWRVNSNNKTRQFVDRSTGQDCRFFNHLEYMSYRSLLLQKFLGLIQKVWSEIKWTNG